MNEVTNFLKRFRDYDNVDDVFTNGCCYWFAFILYYRFPNSKIMYDEVMNHFGTSILDRVYDITGDVTDQYNWKSWDDMEDLKLIKRIYRDCVYF